MKINNLWLSIITLSTVAAISSCGPSKPGSSKIDIQFWCCFGQGLQEGAREIINEFVDKVKQEENVDLSITLEYQGGYDEIYDKISQGLGTGNLPTLAIAYPDHVASYLKSGVDAQKEYVVNLDKFINDPKVGFGKEQYLGDRNTQEVYDSSDIIPTFYQEGKNYFVDGTYSMPFMKSSEALYYNFEAVKRAMKGYKPEIADSDTQIKEYMKKLTWDELVTFSRYILNNANSIAENLESVIFYDSDSNLFISRLYQEKIPYSSEEGGHGKIEFKTGENRSKTETIVEQIADLAKESVIIKHKGKEDTKATLLTTKAIYGQYGSNLFTAEKSIFSIGSTGGAGYNDPDTDVFTVEVAKVPFVNNNPLYVTQGPTLTILNNPSLSKQQNEMQQLYAWKLVKYFTNPKLNTKLCIMDSQGYVPIRESAYRSDEFLDFLIQETIFAKTANVILSDIAGRYINTVCFPGSSELRDYVGTTFASVVGGSSAKDALDTAINAAESYFR